MILVTLGTQKQQFTRLLNKIEQCKIEDEVVVQAGHTKYKSKKMKIFDFIDYKEMDKLIEKADLIITHGGTGSIVTPLKKGKKVIACPRSERYKEHVDNHQIQIVDSFAEVGYILKLDEEQDLNILISRIRKQKMTKFKSNAENFRKMIKEVIDEK